MWQVLRAGDHRRMPWRNGGGETTEVLRRPDGEDYDWRVSIADVTAGGPFSEFPGADRVLTLIGGGGMVLTVDGTVTALERLVPFAFSGDATTSATLPAGATEDLNLITRRGRVTGAVDIVHLTRSDPDGEPVTEPHTVAIGGDQVLVLLLDGHAAVASGHAQVELQRHDALLCAREGGNGEGGDVGELSITGSGVAAVLTIARVA